MRGLVGIRGPNQGFPGGVAVVSPLLHQPVQGRGVGLVYQLPFRRAGQSDDRIPVGYGSDAAGVGADGLAHLGGKGLQIPHRGILAEDHAAILFGVDLQRISLADAEGASNLFRNHNTPEVIPLCQVGAKKFNGFFKKLVVTRVWSFLKVAATRLRCFDRLCYFRDKSRQSLCKSHCRYHAVTPAWLSVSLSISSNFQMISMLSAS